MTDAPGAGGPAGPLLVDQLRFMSTRHPDQCGYRDLDAATAITFREWDEESNRLARWLISSGVERGDRVSIYLSAQEALRWIVTYAAVHKAGAVAVPTNTRLSEREVATILRHAEVSVIVTDPEMISHALHVRSVVPSKPAVLGAPGTSGTGVHPWSEIDSLDCDEIQVAVGDGDVADIMYTSGTTGLPKGVVVRHRDVAMIPNGSPEWSGSGWLHGAPMFTFAGVAFIYNPMKLGLTGLYLPRFDPDRWLDIVEHERPVMVFLVPAMAELIVANPRFETADLSSPFMVSIGSAPLAPSTLRRLQDRMPQATVSNSYGLTEAGPAYIVMPKDEAEHRVGSIGKPFPPMETRIVAPGGDEECPARTVGELQTRLPGKQREYYRNVEATAATWTADGWLRSGDLAYVDEDGFIYLVGRLKDVIIRGGNNVYATDVEAVVMEHPAVREVAVVGVPHAVLGEDVGAWLVLKEGASLTAPELTDFCATRLADYKLPRVVHFVDSLPRNATGKVMKHVLRAQA